MIERKSFDLSKYFDSSGNLVVDARQRLIIDHASRVLEQGTGLFHERINIYTLGVDENYDLFDPSNGKKVKDGLVDDTHTYKLEKEAFLNHIQPWAANPFSQHALWISPPSSEIGYSEARFVLSIPQSDGQILNIALCGPQVHADCLLIAKQLDEFCVEHPNINTIDELRATPLFIDIPDGENYLDFFEKYIQIPHVWEEIRNGNAFERIRWSKQVSAEVIVAHLDQLSKTQSDYERIVVGASMEEYSARLGAAIQHVGSCGLSNSALLDKQGAFNKLFNIAKGKNWEYARGHCRVCDLDKEDVGPCSVCKKCEAEFDRNETVLQAA